MYYVYMLRCRGDTIYTGITADVTHRMRAHAGLVPGGAKYTRAHPPQELAALWQVPDKGTAARLEYAVKQRTRKEKERLIAQPERMRQLLPEDKAMVCLPDVTLDACLEGKYVT